MFKNMKKKLMVIISAILVFTMIPSVAMADEVKYDSVSDYFASFTTGDNALNVANSGNISGENASSMHGTFAAKIVKSGDTLDLVLSFHSGYTTDGLTCGTKTVECTSADNTSKDYVYTIKDVTISDFVKIDGSNYKFTFDLSAHSSKGNKDVSGVYLTFVFPINDQETTETTETTQNTQPSTNETTSNEEDLNDSIGVKILRTGNVKAANIGTEPSGVYGVLNYDKESGIALVKISGNYTKMFMGTYTDAEKASDSQITITQVENKESTMPVKVTALDTPITVSLYSDSMGKWVQYSFEFYKKEIKPTDVEETETALVVDAKEETVVAVSVAQLVNATKPLEIKTKLGTVSFDTKALAGFVAANTDNITFEMKDLKDEPIYKNSKYDMVLDLSLTDDEGNPIFTEGQGGKATITVPYEKEVPAGQKVVVYYIGLTGKEAVEATYDANAKTVTFTVEHFSTYAIAQEAVAATPSTGDNSMTVVTISLIALAVAAAGVTSAVVYKKKAADR